MHLQAEHLDWATDDVLVVAMRPDGVRRRLAAQVKRQFTISPKDETCKNAFRDFWADLNGSEFDSDTDRLALVTLRGTSVLLDGFNTLLDCARASADASDFIRRLEVDRFLSKTARSYAATIRRILDDAATPPTDEQFWRYLSVLHVVSFDLNTASAQNEAWIKALLAATANRGNPLAVAEASWRELLELVGAGMPTAASYKHASLPESLRNRHGPIDTRSAEVVRALSDHSSITLNGIKTTIGATGEIARDALTNQVLDALNENQVVLISAPAGLGKSAVAKACMKALDRDLHCLAFRAEEFSVSHIDQTLRQAQVQANGNELLGILAGQGRKLVLVDSVERLLEASVRDAFTDLLNLAQTDRSLGILITCRDYSLETVSSALLGQAGLAFRVIEVPPLEDEELEQALAAVPQVANALQYEDLKRLLRSPYLLGMAAQMDWSDTAGIPTNEREFRRRCWGEVIRRNAASADGMPERRERVFREVALRRARELRPFVGTEDLDAGALEALRNDGLIVYPPEVPSMAAPGHDVLEDWAIIQWLGQRWILHERAPRPLAQDVGGYPAIRRAYRKWLLDLLRREEEAATDYVLSVFLDETLPPYFRDDTLVCTLQSPSAREFLERHRETLLDNGGRLLVRVIHLLRVACKTSPRWLHDASQLPSQMLVASGEAWSAVLELVLGGIDGVLPEQMPILLGLMEDFANSIDWRDPEPKGCEETAKIGFHLLGYLDDYRTDQMRKRTLTVIAKVPRGDENAFKGLVDRAMADGNRGRLADEVSEVLLGGIDGWFACRYLPEEIMRLTKARFLLREEELDPDNWRPGSWMNIEPDFGIQEHTDFQSFPASSIRGVFLPLLRCHPWQGLDFIIDLLNHAGSWYGEKRWPYHRLEPALRITIEIPGETSVTQWANPRLWGLYRGHEVGPYVLQTALMALEAWLLEICDWEGFDVELCLLRILRDSNNVMATAVAASVCNAHPEKAGLAGLALLSSRELIWMDSARTVRERSSFARSEVFPNIGINEIYENERRKSDALPHRGQDLESLAVKLQFGDGREEVFALIDRHRAALPPVEEQSEEDRLWRLALHRMDVRGFRVVQEPPSDESESSAESVPEEADSRGRQVLLEPSEIEPDVQALVDRQTLIAARKERELSLLNWGRAAWEGRESSHLDIRDWKAFLVRARARDAEPEPEGFMRGGPSVIAAVCVRDHWDEMCLEDRAWCINKLVQEVERDCDTEDDMVRHGRGAYNPDRHAAYVLPGLLARGVSDAQAARIQVAIAKALTHEVEEVSVYAAEGIGKASTGPIRAYSEACIAAIAWQARLISYRLAEERERPFGEQLHPAEIIREVVPLVRAAIVAQNRDPQVELEILNREDWPGTQAARIILQIFGYAPDSTLAIEFHRRIASSIVEGWDQELEDRSRRAQRDYRFNHEFFRRLARFVLRLEEAEALDVCKPFLAAVARHPSEVKDFVRALVVEADQFREEDSFWAVWQAFASAICAAPWIDRLDSRYGSGDPLIRAIFLEGYWKDNVRHWRRLEGQGHRVDELAARFLGSAVVFDAYCRFLYAIGESSLPSAFVILDNSLDKGDPTIILVDRDTVSLLESLLRRQVYSEPHRLKSDRAVRAAVLALLDHLVEAGSSAAYRMRDDFVTPLGDVGG
ncbi:AAA family ATPase [Ectothiorhodospira variabilis]|uniref:nSTAND1 domain-containing NTPase n=1 Tax=Ectothiorhodospira variabilis TaxID=505694 RepID=UPI001EFBF117|nr:AAA family ATPase [Ectothiorhodospira variabilis]